MAEAKQSTTPKIDLAGRINDPHVTRRQSFANGARNPTWVYDVSFTTGLGNQVSFQLNEDVYHDDQEYKAALLFYANQADKLNML